MNHWFDGLMSALGALSGEGVVLEWLVRGACFGIVMSLVGGLLSTRSASWRYAISATTLLGLLLLPLLQFVAPSWQILPVRTGEQGNVPVEQSRIAGPLPNGPAVIPIDHAALLEPEISAIVASPKIAQVEVPLQQAEMSASAPPPVSPWNGNRLELVWFGGIALQLAALLLGWLKLRCLIWSGQQVPMTRLDGALQHAKERLGINRKVRLVLVSESVMPMTTGIWRPVVILPLEARDWSPSDLDGVLRHELAHIARHDCLVLLLAHAGCVLHWLNPLVWWERSRLLKHRELACDDWVVASGLRRKIYAEILLNMVGRVVAPRRYGGMSAAMITKPLEARISRVLKLQSKMRFPLWQSYAVLGLGVLLLAGTIAAVEQASEIESGDSFAAEVSGVVIHTLRATYPNKSEVTLQAAGEELRSFLTQLCATNSVALQRSKSLKAPLLKSLAYQFHRNERNRNRPVDRDRYGRPLPSVVMEDDLRTVQWKLWRALTQPKLTAAEQEERSRQKAALQSYLTVRDQALQDALQERSIELVEGTSVPEFALAAEQEQRAWYRLKEWLLLEHCYRDPLSLVFDRPLAADSFAAVMAELHESLATVPTEPAKYAIARYLNVRQIAGLIIRERYRKTNALADATLPFDDRIHAYEGPRSWDDRTMMRLEFISFHPEWVGITDRAGHFRVAPSVDEVPRVAERLGYGEPRHPLDLDFKSWSLGRPLGARPVFFTRRAGSEHIIARLAHLARLETDEGEVLRRLLEEDRVSSLEALSEIRDAAETMVERRVASKVVSLAELQVKVLEQFESDVESLPLSDEMKSMAVELFADLRRNTVKRVFMVRERFTGVENSSGSTAWTMLSPRQGPDNQLTYSAMVRIGNTKPFPIQRGGDENALCFARLLRGDDDAITLRVETEDPGPEDESLDVEIKRDEIARFHFADRALAFSYGSTWTKRADASERPTAHVFVEFAPMGWDD